MHEITVHHKLRPCRRYLTVHHAPPSACGASEGVIDHILRHVRVATTRAKNNRFHTRCFSICSSWNTSPQTNRSETVALSPHIPRTYTVVTQTEGCHPNVLRGGSQRPSERTRCHISCSEREVGSPMTSSARCPNSFALIISLERLVFRIASPLLPTAEGETRCGIQAQLEALVPPSLIS